MNNNTNIAVRQADNLSAVSVEDYEALSAQKAKELEELYHEDPLPQGFYLSGDNLMYQADAKGDQEAPNPLFICSRLNITACTRDDSNENHGRLLEFKDVDNHAHSWAMPMELLAGDGAAYRGELLDKGLRIGTGNNVRNLLAYYIQLSMPKARARCVSKTGWYHNCFVLPEETIGFSEKERVILQTASLNFPSYAVKGTINEWRDNVSALCMGNSRLIFSLSVAFASPLLNLLAVESGGFHFTGSSSIGKTTALYVAASVWGCKERMQRWRTTINGLEGLAASHNDSLLCLDELSQLDPNVAGEMAYMLANGAGKSRLNRNSSSKKSATWRLLFLSTGEINLSDHMIEAGKKIRAGQGVRIIDISADTHKHGLFEDLHGYSNGAAFSQAIIQNCHTYYGSPSREFLSYVTRNREAAISEVSQFINSFISIFNLSSADGQVYRVARKFGLVAAAGELATSIGITGWDRGDALDAVKACFQDWLNSRGGTGSQEEQSILSQVRRFFEQNGECRFTPWDASDEYRTVNRAGFRKKELGEVEFFVLPETFKAEVAAGFDGKLVAEVCLKHGLLKGGSNGEVTRSEKLPDMTSKKRCYRFTSKVFGDEF